MWDIRRAFSIVEVVMACGIFSVCLLPVIQYSQRGVVEAGAHPRAADIPAAAPAPSS